MGNWGEVLSWNLFCHDKVSCNRITLERIVGGTSYFRLNLILSKNTKIRSQISFYYFSWLNLEDAYGNVFSKPNGCFYLIFRPCVSEANVTVFYVMAYCFIKCNYNRLQCHFRFCMLSMQCIYTLFKYQYTCVIVQCLKQIVQCLTDMKWSYKRIDFLSNIAVLSMLKA